MISKQIVICLMLCCLALKSVFTAPASELSLVPRAQQIYELEEDMLEEQASRAKRDNDDPENWINERETRQTNVRKPLIFKRETNVRKPLLFKRYADGELSKLWYPVERRFSHY